MFCYLTQAQSICKTLVLYPGRHPVKKVPMSAPILLLHGCVLQGFVDSHVHLIPAGLSLTQLSLAHVRSREAFTRVVRDACTRLPPGQWLYGTGWNEALWGGPAPDKSWLDDVSSILTMCWSMLRAC